jgi:hypothetical protein
MKSMLGIICALMVFGGAYGAWCVAAPPYRPQPGVLVLKNGRVLEGSILREGDRWLVTLGDQSNHLRIPVADVELACRDLTDAYLQKRARLRGEDAKPHLDLAEWCIRNKLLDRAADELMAAMAIDPHDRRAVEVEQKLKFALPAAKPGPRPVYRVPLTQEEIAREIKVLSREAQEEFATAIEPMLLQNCATSGCHGPGSKSEYLLVRPPAKNHNRLRETQRNLHATLRQINPDGESRLVTMPQAPHGNAKAAVFDKHDQRLVQQLSAWVELTKRPPEVTEREAPRRDEMVRPAEYWEPFVGGQFDWPEQGRGRGMRRLPPNPFDAPLGPPSGRRGAGARGGAALPPDEEQDEFSPEIFNRRFRGG